MHGMEYGTPETENFTKILPNFRIYMPHRVFIMPKML